jgi:hypothetical protein
MRTVTLLHVSALKGTSSGRSDTFCKCIRTNGEKKKVGERGMRGVSRGFELFQASGRMA